MAKNSKRKIILFSFLLLLYPVLAFVIFPQPIQDLESSVLPRGATFGAQTHTFTWIPDKDQAGAYKIKFKACDTYNACDEEIIMITVVDVKGGEQ